MCESFHNELFSRGGRQHGNSHEFNENFFTTSYSFCCCFVVCFSVLTHFSRGVRMEKKDGRVMFKVNKSNLWKIVINREINVEAFCSASAECVREVDEINSISVMSLMCPLLFALLQLGLEFSPFIMVSSFGSYIFIKRFLSRVDFSHRWESFGEMKNFRFHSTALSTFFEDKF